MRGRGGSATWVSSPRRKTKLNRRVQLAARAIEIQKQKDYEHRSERYRAHRSN